MYSEHWQVNAANAAWRQRNRKKHFSRQKNGTKWLTLSCSESHVTTAALALTLWHRWVQPLQAGGQRCLLLWQQSPPCPDRQRSCFRTLYTDSRNDLMRKSGRACLKLCNVKAQRVYFLVLHKYTLTFWSGCSATDGFKESITQLLWSGDLFQLLLRVGVQNVAIGVREDLAEVFETTTLGCLDPILHFTLVKVTNI